MLMRCRPPADPNARGDARPLRPRWDEDNYRSTLNPREWSSYVVRRTRKMASYQSSARHCHVSSTTLLSIRYELTDHDERMSMTLLFAHATQ